MHICPYCGKSFKTCEGRSSHISLKAECWEAYKSGKVKQMPEVIKDKPALRRLWEKTHKEK